MKRILIGFMLLFSFMWWLQSREADAVVFISGTASTACTTPTTGDTLNEGFLEAGYENTWTESVGTGDTIDEDATLTGSPPSGSCAEGVAFATTEDRNYIYWNNGSVIGSTTNIDIVVDVYISDVVMSAGFGIFTIVGWDDNTNPWETTSPGWIEIQSQSDNVSWNMRGRGSSSSAGMSMSEGVWYTIKLHLDATAASSYVQCIEEDGGTCSDTAQKTFTRNTSSGQYLMVGAINGVDVAGEILDMEVGYAYVDTP